MKQGRAGRRGESRQEGKRNPEDGTYRAGKARVSGLERLERAEGAENLMRGAAQGMPLINARGRRPAVRL